MAGTGRRRPHQLPLLLRRQLGDTSAPSRGPQPVGVAGDGTAGAGRHARPLALGPSPGRRQHRRWAEKGSRVCRWGAAEPAGCVGRRGTEEAGRCLWVASLFIAVAGFGLITCEGRWGTWPRRPCPAGGDTLDVAELEWLRVLR